MEKIGVGMRNNILFFLILSSCGLFAFSFEDKVYSDNIKTVMLFPNFGNIQSQLHPPIIPINQSNPLVLHFDDFSEFVEDYYARIINCNHDWTSSGLPDMDFLREFNEYPVNQYVYSSNTYSKYIHFTFQVPKVRLSGNYLLVVYKDSNRDQPILTKRFVVYENLVNVGINMLFSNVLSQRFSHQQLDAVVTYPNFNLPNPTDLHFYVRQNHRWDNMKYLKPLFMQLNQRMLDYRYFNGENTYPGLNEYRSFDTRSVMFSRSGVEERKTSNKGPEVVLQNDKSRRDLGYELVPDINGKFFILKYESGDGMTDGDYVKVLFTLQTEERTDVKVHVLGAFNDWQISDEFQMKYVKERGAYQLTALLKQGFYNYSYVSARGDKKSIIIDETDWEGSHSAAENVYEGIVYYRGFGSRSDRAIGYTQVSTGQAVRMNNR
ncbi:MAG: type IX secretion system plug protein domain-containing protein [Cytophagales bacterium]